MVGCKKYVFIDRLLNSGSIRSSLTRPVYIRTRTSTHKHVPHHTHASSPAIAFTAEYKQHYFIQCIPSYYTSIKYAVALTYIKDWLLWQSEVGMEYMASKKCIVATCNTAKST